MDNIFILSGIISIVFFLVKFTEMRFIEKENKPLKHLIRDSLFVYFSVLFGSFILSQIAPVIENVGQTQMVFTGNPDF